MRFLQVLPFDSETSTSLEIIFWIVVFLVGLIFVFGAIAVRLRVLHVRMARVKKQLWSNWHPMLHEVLAGDESPETLRRRVDLEASDHFITFLLQYAFVIKGRERALLDELALPFLHSTVQHVNDRDPYVRLYAIHVLATLGPQQYSAVLLGALDDEFEVVAITAARALVQYEPTSKEVISYLPRFEHLGTNHLTSLLSMLPADAAPLLVELYRDSAQSTRVRVIAADALRWQNYAPAVEAAVEIIQSTTDRELLAGSLRLLRRLGTSEHAALVRPICASEDSVVRIHAISALAALGGKEDAGTLRAAFDDMSNWVALRAAQGLVEMDQVTMLEALTASKHPRADLAREMLGEEGQWK